MSITKKYLKGKPICKVRFMVPEEATKSAKKIHIVGDFNGWDVSANPMKKQKDGLFGINLELQCGREYQFRYLIDGKVWENDWEADKYVYSDFGNCHNSVVVI